MSPSMKSSAWANPLSGPSLQPTWARPMPVAPSLAQPAAPPLSPCTMAPVAQDRSKAVPIWARIYSQIRFSKHQTCCWGAFSTVLPAWLLKMKQRYGRLCSSFPVITPVGWWGFAMKQEKQHAQIGTRLNFQEWFLLFQAHLPGVQWKF